MIRLPLPLFIDDGHLAVAEREVNILFRDFQIGVTQAHHDAVLLTNHCLRGRQVALVDLVQIVEVGLQQVVHVDGPQLAVAELLPGFRDEVRDDALCNQLLRGFGVGLDEFGLDVFVVGEADDHFEELEALEAVGGGRAARLDFEVGRDEGAVHGRNVHVLVQNPRLLRERADVQGADVRPRRQRCQVDEDVFKLDEVLLEHILGIRSLKQTSFMH